jgi:hypothetical protein
MLVCPMAGCGFQGASAAASSAAAIAALVFMFGLASRCIRDGHTMIFPNYVMAQSAFSADARCRNQSSCDDGTLDFAGVASVDPARFDPEQQRPCWLV